MKDNTVSGPCLKHDKGRVVSSQGNLFRFFLLTDPCDSVL